MHLVSEWRDFRPEYFNLGVLRTRLPDGIPFLGASATLDPRTLESVKDRCGFDNESTVIQTALDRPEIYIQTSSLQRPMNSMIDLQHLLPTRAESPFDIPKTIIFMDSISSIKKACALMKVWMNQLSYPIEAASWVAPFFSDMATQDKERIAARFEMPSNQCKFPRILIATDAYGLGIDNPDVMRVTQWLLPSSMAKLYQRLGRALRCGRGQAHFTLLHPSWCMGPRSGSKMDEQDGYDAGIEIESKASKRRINQKDADRRRDMPPGLWEIINVPSDGCVRGIGLNFFNDKVYPTSAYVKPQPCCSICDPSFQTSTAANEMLNRTAERDSSRRPWFTVKLREWREAKAQEKFPNSHMRYFPSLIMPDEVLNSLTTWADQIVDEPTMRRWIGNTWTGIRPYGAELLEILKRGQAMRLDEGDMFEEWKRHNDIKRKRLPSLTCNSASIEFEERRKNWMIKQGYMSRKVFKKRNAVKKKVSKESESTEPLGENPAPNHNISDAALVVDNVDALKSSMKASKTKKAPRDPMEALSLNIPMALPPTRSRQERKCPVRYL